MSDVQVKSHIPEILAALRLAVGSAVRQTALGMRTDYANDAAKLTGFMASSAYVVTDKESTYGTNLVGAGPLLPEIPRAEDDTTAFVAVGASYAAYPEFGTSRMGAQPAFYPAFDKAAKTLERELDRVEREVAKAGIREG